MPFVRGDHIKQEKYDQYVAMGYSEERMALELNYVILIKSYFKARYNYDTFREVQNKFFISIQTNDKILKKYSHFISLIIGSLWEAAIMNLSHLIDKDSIGGYKNLTIGTYLDDLCDICNETPYPLITERIINDVREELKDKDIKELKSHIKKIRSKITAHIDYDIYSSPREYFEVTIRDNKPDELLRRLEPILNKIGFAVNGPGYELNKSEPFYKYSREHAKNLMDNIH